MIITIDGPAASGKSSVAKMLAKDLNMFYLSSGMVFRAVSYILKNYYSVSLEDLSNVSEKQFYNILDSKDFSYIFFPKDGKIVISYKGDDITPYLKNREMDEYSSILGGSSKIRPILKSFQQALAKQYDMVVEGRDIGSAVFPNADYKFFLTAALKERAKRWQKMQKNKGNVFSLNQAEKIIKDRDERDMKREYDPLIIPEDAIVVDNSDLQPYQTVEKFKDLLKRVDDACKN